MMEYRVQISCDGGMTWLDEGKIFQVYTDYKAAKEVMLTMRLKNRKVKCRILERENIPWRVVQEKVGD